jgi:hypothetical protein
VGEQGEKGVMKAADDKQAYGHQNPANAECGLPHYLCKLHNIFRIHTISVRPQRCCYHAFAAHMPACSDEMHFPV